MTKRLHGRLELTWTNKDDCLLADEQGAYEWVPPSDYRVAEVRILREAATVGTPDADGHQNLLIRGDALNALAALRGIPEYADRVTGRVRLAYLDPPFNTQQSFLQYDDALEHSVWLTMMRDRLQQIRTLLARDGSVWVHVDDAEMAYCRMLMDEVFGRDNFVGCVIWKRRNDTRNTAVLSANHDYILVFAADIDYLDFNLLPRTEDMDARYSNPDDDPRGPWLRSNLNARNYYSKGTYPITTPGGRYIEGPPAGSYWRLSEERLQELDEDGRIYWGVDGNSLPYIKRFLSEVQGGRVPNTVWEPEEVGFVRQGKNEGRALLGVTFDTPKPERLMERIIQIGTRPGDLVLDCFLGSATTAAVAHKLRRQWIGVERSHSTLDTFAIPRLTKVVAGEDHEGITADSGWHGGGGFRILDVAPSMFEDDDGLVVLADWATNGALGEATAAQLGYRHEPAAPFCGRKGRNRLAVIDGLVSTTVIDLLLSRLGEDEQLTVCGTSVDPDAAGALRAARPGSRVRKIPASLLTEYQEATRWRPRLLEADTNRAESRLADALPYEPAAEA